MNWAWVERRYTTLAVTAILTLLVIHFVTGR